MASIGLNVAADGSASISKLRSLNATWIRVVATGEHDLSDYFRSCRASALRILLVLARESFAGIGGLILYRDRYGALVDAIQVGNEADLVSPSSWDMTTGELTALGKSVRGVFPTMPLVCAGMASGHPDWMAGMDLSWCDAVAAHPYLKDSPNPSDLEDLADMDVLVRAYQQFGKPVIVSEWGWWGDDEPRAAIEVDDAVGWAAATSDCAVFFYFCLTDAMVPPFGLLRADGREKERAKRFRKRAAGAKEVAWLPTETETPVPDYRAIARANAVAAGIDPGIFERQIQQESGFNPKAFNAGSGATGIAQIIKRWHPTVDPTDPIASLSYAATWMAQLLAQYGSYVRALAAYNWGPGNVAGWDGRRATLPAETRHYLDVILGAGWDSAPAAGRVRYNASEPAVAQNDQWSCAPSSTRWSLKALGRNPSESWIESTMIAEGVVSQAQGLLDATGAGLAEFVTRHYGEYGLFANSEPSVTFDGAALEGDHAYPILIGGRAWNHWSGVRGYDAEHDLLLLANPSGGWQGVGQTMSRAQFTALGPFSMVRVLHADLLEALPPAPVEPPPIPALSRALVLVKEIRERLAELETLVA